MTDLASLGVSHLSGAVPAELRARLQSQIDTWVEHFDPQEHRAVFTSDGAHLENQTYFLASARNVSCFLEAGAVDAQGQLTCDKHRAINKIGHALHDYSEAFAELARLPAFAKHLAQRGAQAWELMQTMVIMKPPHIGGQVNWHQDGTFLIDQQQGCLGIWIALEDADSGNGCLQFGPSQPLSQRMETDHASGQTQFVELGTPSVNAPEKPIFAPCQAGDAVVFDGLTPHASAPNTSALSRRAITLHFKPADSEWLPCNWLQRGELPRFLVNA